MKLIPFQIDHENPRFLWWGSTSSTLFRLYMDRSGTPSLLLDVPLHFMDEIHLSLHFDFLTQAYTTYIYIFSHDKHGSQFLILVSKGLAYHLAPASMFPIVIFLQFYQVCAYESNPNSSSSSSFLCFVWLPRN